MCNKQVVNLHNHAFSVRDSLSKVDELVMRAKELGQPAIALTDHGVMNGIPELFRQCKKHGVKPIAGLEAYFTPHGRESKEPVTGGGYYYHLLLIAKNKKGYHNLLKLSSEGYMSGFYRKPRIDWELLYLYHEGLVCTSTCLGGYIPQLIMAGEEQEAYKIAQRFKDLFGDDFYFEIQPHDIPAQILVNKQLVKMSKEMGIPLLATGDVHYTYEDDCIPHQAILCIGSNARMLSGKERKYEGGATYYLRNYEQMFNDFKKQGLEDEDIKEALTNTVKVAEQVDFDLKKDKNLLPKYDCNDPDTALLEAIKEGLKRKVKVKTAEDKMKYLERVKYELSVIKQRGYQEYFLIVHDAVKWCRQNGIMAGFPGRGSGGGCLIAYLLDIVEVDPLRFGLFFERFLDVTREKMPDIDTDVEDIRRYELLKYLGDKYGHDKVAQITNYGKMQPKLALKNALQAYDVPFAEANKISKSVSDNAKTLEEVEELKPLLKKKLKRNDGKMIDFKTIYHVALRFQGALEKIGKHAGGVLISPTPITDYFPLMGTKEEPQVQFDKDDVEELGGVKFDFLGLSNLAKISLCLKFIKERYNKDVDVYALVRTLDDPKVYKTIQSGNTKDIFQLGKTGARELIKKIKPDKIEHIVAINALNRPAALQSGQDKQYVKRRNGLEEVVYDHPDEKQYLEENYGLFLYQENSMQLAKQFAGWSYGKGDKLRKMEGWTEEEIKEWEEQFIADAVKRGYSEETAYTIWSKIKDYNKGGYGFNKSHAVAYSVLGYVNAWLKTYYPHEWLSACLEVDKNKRDAKDDDKDKFKQNIEAVHEHKVKLFPPDINKSDLIFRPTDDGIYTSLLCFKNVGINAVKEIIKNRPYSSLDELLEKCDSKKINKRTMESLIMVGAFDELHPDMTRGELFRHYMELKEGRNVAEEIEKQKVKPTKVGKEFIDEALKYIQLEEEKGKERLYYLKEKEYFGFSLKSNPLNKYNFRPFDQWEDGQKCYIGGFVLKLKEIKDKRGNKMAFLTIETLHEFIECVCFASTWQHVKGIVEKDECYLFTGKKDGDKLIINDIELLEV